MTTALTDRPYSNPLALYGASSLPAPLGGAAGATIAASGNTRRDRGVSIEVFGVRVGGNDGVLAVEEEEDDGLAEVDFRQQYDDFA